MIEWFCEVGNLVLVLVYLGGRGLDVPMTRTLSRVGHLEPICFVGIFGVLARDEEQPDSVFGSAVIMLLCAEY